MIGYKLQQSPHESTRPRDQAANEKRSENFRDWCTEFENVKKFEPALFLTMGISRDSRHKRAHTGAKRAQYRKKRKFELGRQAANTKIGEKRITVVRVRGGNLKYRALRLDSGILI